MVFISISCRSHTGLHCVKGVAKVVSDRTTRVTRRPVISVVCMCAGACLVAGLAGLLRAMVQDLRAHLRGERELACMLRDGCGTCCALHVTICVQLRECGGVLIFLISPRCIFASPIDHLPSLGQNMAHSTVHRSL
jgi:hypothetical protein